MRFLSGLLAAGVGAAYLYLSLPESPKIMNDEQILESISNSFYYCKTIEKARIDINDKEIDELKIEFLRYLIKQIKHGNIKYKIL